ncbi:MAG: hypothetical protein ACKVQQ_06950 [Burkholderiales bacterium]
MKPARALARLEALRLVFGSTAAEEKRTTLAALAGARFASAATVQRLHEILCFIAAYPDNAQLLAAARRELARFAHRPDLARFRDDLADTGIAGTATHYNFFWMMSRWLAERLPRRLALDWDRPDFVPRLKAALPILLPALEAEAVKRSDLPLKEIIDRLRGRERDASFVIRHIKTLPDDAVREHFHDAIDSAYIIEPAPGFPSRSTARHDRAPLVFRKSPPPSARPDLARELKRRPLTVRRTDRAEGRALIDLAREAMLTRARDLAAFSWGNEDDVQVVDDGDGLAFAIIGSLPEHRLPLPAVHGWIMLRNRVPVGYVQTDTLLAASEISFNVFETFRGAEAGYLFARVLAVTRHLFNARAFSIEPYQLGDGNDEGLASGAWWFYYKLGFRPIAEEPKRILASELRRMARDPTRRSGPATLKRLARGHLVWEPEAGRRAWLPLVPALGLRRTYPAPDAALQAANKRYGIGPNPPWSVAELAAWKQIALLALSLSGVERWTRSERQSAAATLKSKGAKSESVFLRSIDAHSPLAVAMQALLNG